MKSFINHLYESNEHYEKAEENKKSADAAKKQGDMFAHHLHMADHHDNMSQWHDSKGRHGEANKHAEKADEHHEKAMALKESVDLAEGLDPSEIASNPRMYSAADVKKAYYHKNATEDQKKSIANHLDRYHGSKEWRKTVKEGYNHHDNRTGFGKRRREDDEYHVPDPTTTTHKIVHKVSHPDVEGGKQHNRTVTISNTTKSRAEAHAAAKAHLEKQGYKIHEEVQQIDELSSDTLQSYKDKAMKSAEDEASKGNYKKSTDRLMGHMKATGKQMSKLLKKEEAERCEVCGKVACECDDSHGFVEGLKPEHNMKPGWMLKADPELAKKVAENKKKFKSFKDTVGKKIETK